MYPVYVHCLIRMRVPSMSIVRLSSLARRADTCPVTIVGAEPIVSHSPAVFPALDRVSLPKIAERQTFPAITAVLLRNARVTGGTNLTLLRNQIVCHDLYDFLRDFTSEELHGRTVIDPKDEHARWRGIDPRPESIPSAASFVDACSGNYAHWMTEVLPRVNLFCSDRRFSQVPIIVDDGLHQNLMESLVIVAGDARTVILLPFERTLRVANLHLLSATGYVPFSRRNPRLGGHSHGIFSPFALGTLRTKLIDSVGAGGNAWPRQIYIRRNSSARRLVNGFEIEETLLARGFSIIEPERLSFAEQVQLFSQAETVVGATGAALANLVFCRPSARIVIMIAKHEHMPYWYWQNIARSVACEVRYVLGEMVRFSGLGIHGNFRVNPGDVLDAIE